MYFTTFLLGVRYGSVAAHDDDERESTDSTTRSEILRRDAVSGPPERGILGDTARGSTERVVRVA
jgi:hypothetical protein